MNRFVYGCNQMSILHIVKPYSRRAVCSVWHSPWLLLIQMGIYRRALWVRSRCPFTTRMNSSEVAVSTKGVKRHRQLRTIAEQQHIVQQGCAVARVSAAACLHNQDQGRELSTEGKPRAGLLARISNAKCQKPGVTQAVCSEANATSTMVSSGHSRFLKWGQTASASKELCPFPLLR